MAFLYYWYPDLSLARGVAALSAPLIIITVAGWRLVVDAGAPFLRRSERILIVGDGPSGSRLAEEVLRRPELNIGIVGFLNEANSDHGDHGASLGRGYRASFGAAPMHYSLRYSDAAGRSGASALALAGSAEGVLSGAAATAKEPAFAAQAVAPRVIGTTAMWSVVLCRNALTVWSFPSANDAEAHRSASCFG